MTLLFKIEKKLCDNIIKKFIIIINLYNKIRL